MSFGTIAADYDRLRPSPPAAAVDWLLAGTDPAAPGRPAVVDVGAGTGLLSRALAARVPQVIAVEPDERMRAVLAARSPGVTVVEGRGEAIPLPDASADGVYVSSAWHWMDPALTVPEIARVLRDGGRFGAIWTGADRDAGWLRDLDSFFPAGWDRRGPGQGQPGRAVTADGPAPRAGQGAGPEPGPGPQPGPDGGDRPRRRDHRQIALPDDAPFAGAETAVFAFVRPMTVSDYVGMLATYSKVVTASPAERAALLDQAGSALAARFPGVDQVDVPMRARCWRAGRLPRSRPRP